MDFRVSFKIIETGVGRNPFLNYFKHTDTNFMIMVSFQINQCFIKWFVYNPITPSSWGLLLLEFKAITNAD